MAPASVLSRITFDNPPAPLGERVAIRQLTESRVRGSAETALVRSYAGHDTSCRSRVLIAFLLCLSGYLYFAQPTQQRLLAEPQTGTVTLGGWVHAEYGQAVPSGVSVRLETNEGMIGGEQAVNTSGYFEFLGLIKTSYRLTVTAPGFQTYEQNLDLGPVGDKLVLTIFLSPASKTKSLAPSASSFTDNNAPKKARQEYEKGDRALRARNLSEAQSHFERSVKEYPCYARAQSDLALVLSETHQFPASEAALKKALECDPDYLDAYNELGQLYYNQQKYKDSETVLLEGLRRSPASWQFYYQLGADHYHLGQYSRAEQEYLKAQSLNSSVPQEIHIKLADVYLKQHAYDKAYAEMRAYVRAEPNGRYATRVHGLMRQMESDHTVEAARPASAQPALPAPPKL